MALLPALRRGLETMGLMTPAEGGAPEEEGGGAPVLDRIISQSPELRMNGAYFKGLQVNPDVILRREGGQDLELFDRLLDDDVAMSTMQQRRLAITSRDWEVTPGDDEDPRSVEAAEEFREMLDEVGFDRVTGLLHYGVWYGYAVGEALWTTKARPGGRRIWLDDVVVPDRRWFGFDHAGELRFSTMFGFDGETLPRNKFFTVRTGGTHDFAFYGLGLAHWAYWPIWFKRAAARFWALYLEKLANPTVIGPFSDAMSQAERNELLSTLVAIGLDSAAIVPKEIAPDVKFMEAQRGGTAGSGFREFVTEQNESLMRIVLGQPGTSKATPGGIGSTQSEVHAGVKAELVKADADLICEAINCSLAKWVTRWNHGEDVKPPKVFRVLDDEEDLNTTAERDKKLDELGWTRTDDSFEQVYGEGYERKPEPEPPVMVPGQMPALGDPRLPANDEGEADEEDPSAVAFSAAEEDAIERLTVALASDANPAIKEFAASIRESLATAKEEALGELSLEGARVALLQAFERFDPAALAKLTGLAFVATRAAAEAGVEDDLTA